MTHHSKHMKTITQQVKTMLLALLLAGSLLSGRSYGQTIRYVKPSGSGNGSTWANASSDLQAMINASGAGDEVWVAAGTYKPTSGTDRNISFAMKSGVAIYGGFNGTETQLSQRNWRTNVTTLSGDIGISGNNSDNSYSVIVNEGINSAIFDGFTVTQANSTPPTGEILGGGIYNAGSSPTIRNCIFSNNTGSYANAGIFNYNNGTPTIINCLFINNVGSLYSSGVFNFNCSANITNCTFYGNHTAISNQGGNALSVRNCILWGNNNQFSLLLPFPITLTVANSIIQGGWSGTGNLATDPLFADAPNGDLRLTACSPAINAGSNAAYNALSSPPATDLGGRPRFFPSGGTIDMGAYEFQGTPSQLVSVTKQPPTGANVCEGSTVTVPVEVSGTTVRFEWYKDEQLVAGQTSATLSLSGVTTADAGSYKLKIIGACNNVETDAYVLTVKPLPTASISTNNGPVCSGSDASFTVSGTSGATLTYTITGQSGNQTLMLTGSPQTIPSPNATADVTLTLVSVSLDGCEQILSVSSKVVVNALPSLTLGMIPAICAGATSFALPYTASSQTPTTYSVSGAGVTAATEAALPGSPITVNLSVPASGGSISYTLTVQNAAGCVSEAINGSVTVKALPTASIGTNNGPVCSGSDASFTVSGTSGATLTYTLGNQTYQTLLTGFPQTLTASNVSADVTLTLVSVSLDGCEQILSVSSKVVVNALPSLTLGMIPAICSGATSFTLPYTASSQTPTTYSVSGAGVAAATEAALPGSPITVNLSAPASGGSISFTLLVKNAAGCVSEPINGSVTVKALPTASLGTNNSPVCSGQNATFTVSGTSGATLTYTLTGQSGNQTLVLTGGSQTIPVNNATSDVTLTLVSVELNGCTQNLTGSSTVIVKPQPSASISTNNGPICAGGNASFTLSGTSGATLTYTITGQVGNQTLALTGSSQTLTVSNATSDATLTLLGITLNGCSQNLSGSSTVTVKPLPTASISTNNGPICAGGNASFTLSGTSGATLTYTITGQVGNQTLALTGSSQTLTVSNATSDATLTLLGITLNGCSQNLSGSSTVTVKPLPTASISTNNGPICAGQSATFTLSGASGATLTYTITGQVGNQTLALTGSSQTIPVNNATADATLTLVSVEKDGCTLSLSGSSTVTVKPLPTASISTNNGPICAGGNASFILSGTSGATLTYTLTGQAGNQTLALTGSSQTIPVSNATSDATLTLVGITLNGCSQNLSGSSTVTVKPLPTASISTNNGPICAGQNASFTISGTSGATLTYTITGQVGNQTLALTGGSQTLTVSNATSDATLTLVSVALNGCTQNLSGSSTVTVRPATNCPPAATPALSTATAATAPRYGQRHRGHGGAEPVVEHGGDGHMPQSVSAPRRRRPTP